MNKWTKDIFSDKYIATIVSEFLAKIIKKNEQNFLISKIFGKGTYGCIIMSDAINKKQEKSKSYLNKI